MMAIVAVFLMLLLLIILVAFIPVSISLIAYLSRKSKRNKIRERLSPEITYSADVRLNTAKKNDTFLKVKAFEFSGILYLLDNKICVDGARGEHYEFELSDVVITWPGVQVQNGALQWFCLDDMKGQKLFVNAETGVFVFRLSSKKQSTREIFNYLLTQQRVISVGQ